MRTNAETDRLSEKLSAAHEVAAWCELFHAENSAYIDPVFGKFEGQAAIQRWLVEMMGRAGRWKLRNIGSRFFDGHIAAGESALSIPIGPSNFELPFAWIQRYEDGYIVYRRDYYDTHELRKNAGAYALREPESEI